VSDYAGEAVPMLARMFGKRKIGYRAIGNRIQLVHILRPSYKLLVRSLVMRYDVLNPTL